MKPTARESVRLAYSQVGYKAPGPGKKNKFAYWFDHDMPGFFNYKKNGANVDWCAIFCCFCIAYLAKVLNDACYVMCTPKKSCAAGVEWLYDYFKAKQRNTSIAHYGDIIFFSKNGKKSGLYHVGFVYKVTDKYVYWCAGNEGGGHGAVKKHKYLKTNKKIFAYGRPRYAEDKAA